MCDIFLTGWHDRGWMQTSKLKTLKNLSQCVNNSQKKSAHYHYYVFNSYDYYNFKK